MSSPKLPTGENILLAAFQALEQKPAISTDEMIAKYDHYFKSSVATPIDKSYVFEKFSLVDPRVRLTIQSHTSSQ